MATKTTIAIEMKDGSKPEVPGYVVAPGLGVHRALLPDGKQGSDWNVVHITSGRRVCGSFPTRRDAMTAATEFAPLADWTKIDGSGEFKPIVGKVLSIRNRILWNTDHPGDQRKAADTATLVESDEVVALRVRIAKGETYLAQHDLPETKRAEAEALLAALKKSLEESL